MRHRATAALAIATAVVIAATLADGAMTAWQSRDASGPRASALAGTGIVTGVIVTDTADPQPVRRATVRLSGDGSTPRLVGTNDEGRFVFDRLPPGRFTVSASKAGFVQGFHGSTRPGRGRGVPVAIGEGETAEVTIRLLPGAAITGIITDSDGNPAAGVPVAAVAARASGGSAPAPAREVTDDRGVYRIFGLPPGEYVVSAIPQLQPASVARGVPPASAVVVAVTREDVQRARAAAGAVAGVGADTVASARPTASAQPLRPVAYAPVFYPGTTDASAAATVRVVSGQERTGIDMPLRVVALARVAGTVVDASGGPVTSATLTLVPKRSDPPSVVDALVSSGTIALPRATLSAAGFAFSGVAPGQYMLIARTGSGQRGAVAAEAGAPTLWSVMDVAVDGNDRTDLSLRLLPGLAVSGRYVLEGRDGAAISPASLNLSLVATDPYPGVPSTFRAVVQPDGTFRVASLAPGGYVVRADIPSAAGASPWVLKSSVVNGRDLADHPVMAEADGTELSGVVVTFTDRAAEVSGRLIDASGHPVTRYSIVMVTVDRSLWLPNARRIRAAQPATDGSFTVGGLPPGEYAIAAVADLEDADLSDAVFLSDLLATSFTLTLAEGEQKVQDLRTSDDDRDDRGRILN